MSKYTFVQYFCNHCFYGDLLRCPFQSLVTRKLYWISVIDHTSMHRYISMTQLLLHTFAHLTGLFFRLRPNYCPIKNTWVNPVKKWPSFSTTFMHVCERPKKKFFSSSLAFNLNYKEGPVRFAKVCNKKLGHTKVYQGIFRRIKLMVD